MLLPYNFDVQLTTTEYPIYAYEEVLKTESSEKIDHLKPKSTPLTESQWNKTSSEKETQYQQDIAHRPTEYSDTYVSIKIRSVITNVTNHLENWLNNGTDNSLGDLVSIKRTLETNTEYLQNNANTRLLLAALELIFENNNWENMQPTQIRHLATSLKSFNDSKFEIGQIKTFIRSMYLGKITILSNVKEETKKTV